MRLLNLFRIESVLILVLGGMAVWQLGGAAYIHAKAHLAQYLMESAWQRSDGARSRIAPWPWADSWPVARLELPRFDKALLVLSDATGRSMAFGPGVLQHEALYRPGATLVIAGHRDTHFTILRDLRVGDALRLRLADRTTRHYRVAATRVIDIRKQQLMIEPDASELILTTCYPFDAVDPGGPLRYVVIATREETHTTPSVSI